MKRTNWLKRKTPLKRGKRLNPFGRRYKRLRAEKKVFGPLCDFVRKQRCWGCSAMPPSDPHHVRSRGAGYTDWYRDQGNVIPLCRTCHDNVALFDVEAMRWWAVMMGSKFRIAEMEKVRKTPPHA
jgi:hypothetical protein